MFSARLKERREHFGFSQQELAARVGVSQSQIWRYENEGSDVTGDVLGRLARELDCTADYLIGLTDELQGHYRRSEMNTTERELLAAYRRGDLSEALLILSQRARNGTEN